MRAPARSGVADVSPASQPSVDVIIDNCDYGRFLGACIDSALAQTHDNLQVIVVDDGSSDESREVIAGYGSRVTAVHKPNGGQASAFNAGFTRGEGDIVVFLDADDVLLPELAAEVAQAFAASPQAAKVQYRMAVIDERGRATGETKPPSDRRLPAGTLWREELTFPFDLPWMPTSGNAFARRVLERLLPVPEEEYRLGADWYLVHLSPLFGPVVALDRIGAAYRVHGDNRYERPRAVLDLDRVRQSVAYAATTRAWLEHTADALGLPRHPGPILSVADLANRLISLRLDAAKHPLATDRVAALMTGALRAIHRRFDLRWPRQALIAGWFLAMALAPVAPATRLAEQFVLPERRWQVSGRR
jgi:glycosyltransferase involved in cell wall biosynthesis